MIADWNDLMRRGLLAAGLLLLLGVVAICADGGPHQFSDDQCAICHDEPPGKAKKRGRPRRSVSDKCLTCHQKIYEDGYMHPVDLPPSKIEVPRDFPLSEDGLLTCNTCHDPHASHEVPWGGKSSFLRRLERGKAFCDACHGNLASQKMGHSSAFQEAHFTSKYEVNDPSQSLDPMSRNCISCHDGAFGSAVDIQVGSWTHGRNFIKFDKGGKHPIGMDYERSRRDNPRALLKPTGDVDPRLRLFNGRIGCGTCHNPFSTEGMRLVMPQDRSTLCFACHSM